LLLAAHRKHLRIRATRMMPSVLQERPPADDLGQQAKGDEKKAAIAALIQSRTTVSNHWLAETLQLGTPVESVNRFDLPKPARPFGNRSKRSPR